MLKTVGTLLLIFVLCSCQPKTVVEYVETPAVCTYTPDAVEQTDHDKILPTMHINGSGIETPEEIYLLFEYKMLNYTKYQVSFISCTCRPVDEHYRQIMYLELNNDASVKYVSFGEDTSDNNSVPGHWGDASPIPVSGQHTAEDFERDLLHGYLVGKTPSQLDGKTNLSDLDDWPLADTYVGNSVSVNNILRTIITIQKYQLSK